MVRRFAHHSFQPDTAPCPNAGRERDDEHARAAVVHAGGDMRPQLERTLRANTIAEKRVRHTHTSPLIVHDAQSDEIGTTLVLLEENLLPHTRQKPFS